jgi:hypothetical protein
MGKITAQLVDACLAMENIVDLSKKPETMPEVVVDEEASKKPRRTNGRFIPKTPAMIGDGILMCQGRKKTGGKCNQGMEWKKKLDGCIEFPPRLVCWNPKCDRFETKLQKEREEKAQNPSRTREPAATLVAAIETPRHNPTA